MSKKIADADAKRATWRKSSYSGTGGGTCVEVAENYVESDEVVLVRDSKNPNGPHLEFSAAAWGTFAGWVSTFDV